MIETSGKTLVDDALACFGIEADTEAHHVLVHNKPGRILYSEVMINASL